MTFVALETHLSKFVKPLLYVIKDIKYVSHIDKRLSIFNFDKSKMYCSLNSTNIHIFLLHMMKKHSPLSKLTKTALEQEHTNLSLHFNIGIQAQLTQNGP
jgi:hypothetical protein